MTIRKKVIALYAPRPATAGARRANRRLGTPRPRRRERPGISRLTWGAADRADDQRPLVQERGRLLPFGRDLYGRQRRRRRRFFRPDAAARLSPRPRRYRSGE